MRFKEETMNYIVIKEQNLDPGNEFPNMGLSLLRVEVGFSLCNIHTTYFFVWVKNKWI